MNEDQLKFLWDNYANNKGFSNYDEFKSLMSDDGNRKLFFDDSNKELGFTDYNEFESLLGVKKKGATTQGSSQPVQQPGKPSAPSFGQKVVSEAITQEVQIPLRGQQKPPVQKKPYQDIYYKPEALPSETTQTVETPVIKAAKQDFKQTQIKPPVKPPVTEQGIKELEEKIGKPDETRLKFQDYQTSVDDLDDLENLYDADINTFQAKLSRRPDLYAKYSGRTEQETIDFFNALNDPNPLRQNEAKVQWDVEKDAVYDNFVNDYKSLKSKHGKTVADLDVMTDKLASDIVNEKTYKDFLAKREFAVSTTGAEATYGQVINMGEVDRVATEIVDGYGLPTDSDAWRLMKNKIKATVFSEYMKPKVQEELKRSNPELLAKRQQIFEAGFEADDDIYAKTDSVLTVLQTQYEQDAKREMDLINSEYVNTSKKLNEEYEQYNAGIEQQQLALNDMRKNNQIDQLEYESAFTKLEEDKKAFHNQYQAKYPSYDEYVKKSNEINSRYNRKFEIQKKIIIDKAQAELEAAYKKYAETYQEDPELLKQLNEAYKTAYDTVAKQRGEKMKLGATMSANPFSSLYNSTLSAMGGVFKGWGGSLNSKSLELLGETMEQNFEMPAPRTEDFSDWTDPQNVSMITGNVLGSMGPTMIPTAAAAIGTTYFTGGLGAPASVSMVTAGLAGALAGWGAETIDMAGRSYLDVFERSGGDVARANQAAKRTVKSQYDIMWAYSFEALPFIGKALKFIPTTAARVAVGGGVELATEFTQEIRQNIAEENIVEFERDPWYNFDESINDERRRKQTLISIGPVALMGGAGQIGSKSIYQDRRDAAIAQQQKSALVNALPDQKRQYIQNMVFNRNGKFATNVIASLYAAGKIDEKQSADLMLEIQRAEQIKKAGKSAGLSGSKLNIYGFYSARAEEAERNAGRFANDPILKKSYEDMAKKYRDAGVEFMNGKNPDLLTLTYADGSQAIMMPEDVNALFADPIALSLLNQKAISIEAYDEKGQGPKIIEELRSRAETYAKSNRYTEASQIASPMQSLRQNINERIQQLYAERQELSEKQKQQEAERIRQEEIAAYEEKQKQRQEEERGNRDIEIERLQEERAKIGVNEVDAFFSDMKPLVATMVERMEAGQPAPKSGVRAASDYLYAKYKELTAMKSDPNRMLTIAQIESIQAQIEQDLQTLEGNPPSQKTETNDQENIQGVSGQVGVGQEPVTAQPIEGTGTETTEAGGVLQAQREEIDGRRQEELKNITPALEGKRGIVNTSFAGTEVSADIGEGFTSIQDIELTNEEKAEAKRQFKLQSLGVITMKELSNWKRDFSKRVLQRISDEINAKYDAELAALGAKPTTEAAPVSDKKADIEKRRQEDKDKNAHNIKVKIEEFEFLTEEGNIEKRKVTHFADGSKLVESINSDGEVYAKEKIKKGDTRDLENSYGITTQLGEKIPYTKKELPVTSNVLNKINAKYDAEVAALEAQPTTEAAPTPNTKIEGRNDNGTVYKSTTKEKDGVVITNYRAEKDGKKSTIGGRRLTKEQFLSEYEVDEDTLELLDGVEGIDISEIRDNKGKLGISTRLKFDGLWGEFEIAASERKPTTEAAPEVKAEEKPTAPATEETKPTKPTRKERISKIFDTEGEKAAEGLAKFYDKTGIDVEIIDDVEAQRLGQERNMEGNLEGLFIADKDSSKIYLNRDALKRVGRTLAYHEGIHPVINIIRNTNPELYKKVLDGIRAEAKRNPAIARAIRQVESVKEYQKRGPEAIEDETIVEVLARIAAGDIDLNKVDKTVKDNLIRFWNWIAKALRLPTVNPNASTQEFRDFAKKLSTALTQGGKLADVVGVENITEFAPPPSLDIKEKENISNYEEDVPIPGVIRAGQASVEIDRSTNTPIDVYQEKGVKKLPVKTLKQIYDKFNKKVVVINSDPTRVGWLTLPSGKRIFMYGGPGYLSVLDNTKGDVGFATTQESKVKSWKKYVDELFGKKPGVTLIATQAPTAILSNSYALRYVLDAISQLPKSVLESETFKSEFFGNDIVLLKDAFGDKKYNEFINKYKNADLSNPKIIDNMISEMSYTVGDNNAPASFKARGAFVANLLGGLGEKSKSQKIEGDKGYYSKKPQKYIASELMNRLGINAEKVIRDIGEPGLVDLYMNEGKWGFAVSGFETDPNMDISSIQNLGVTHPLFNAKFPGKNAFLLDGAYEIDAMFKPIKMTGPKGEPYTKRASLMLAGSMYVKGGVKQGKQTFKYEAVSPSGIGVLPVPTPERITKASENLQAKFRRDGIPLSKQEAIEIVEELASWKDWYEGIAEMVQDNFGEYAADYMMFMFGSAVAADSAGTIGTALNNLERLYAQEEIKGLPIMKRNIYEILSGLPVSSDKISNFIAAGLGDKNAIPVDMHVWSFINSFPETKGPTKKDFDKAKEFVRAVADGLGWDPREVQAAMWAANMLRLGQRPDTYEEYIQKKIDAGLQEQIQGWRDKGYKPVFAVRQAGEKIETVFLQEEKKAEFAPKLEEVKRAISPKGQPSVSIDRSKEGDLQPLPEGISIVNGWYSPIEKRLRETKADKQSAQKWLTSGIIGKGDEAIYTGVKGWLESKKPNEQVSKQEILDWMDNNRVEIQEVSKSDEPKMSNAEARNVFENQGYDVVTDSNGDTYVEKDEELYDYEDMSPVEQDAFDVLTRGNLDTGRETQTKYETYQLEGEKKNYKELLVTLPSKSSQNYKIVKGKDGKYRIKNPDGSINQGRYWSVRSAAESALVGDIKRAKTTFQSTHFEEPNILVHLRMNTRTDADGKKVLFLEELQSDWGQKGKKEGFKPLGGFDESKISTKAKPNNKLEVYYDNKLVDELFTGYSTNDEVKKDVLNAAKNYFDYNLSLKNVPLAPFVTDTNAWTKLGLKMALREAVKQGADKVAWTTGEQQNQRYDLSKQVDSINYLKNGDGTYQVYAKKDGNIIFKERALEENKLEGAFGKDVAERIINDKGTSEEGLATKVLSGSDLSVGGKGMKGFYDNIVPNVATALVKELTGEPGAIGTTTFGTRENVGQSMPVRSTEDIKFYSRKGYEFMKGHRVVSKQDAYAIIEEGGEVTAVIAPSSEQQSIEITPKLKASVSRGIAQFSAQIPRTPSEVRKAMEDSGDAVEQAIASGTDPQTAVDDLIGSQDWYNELTPRQKEQFDEILQDEFGVTPKAPKAKPTGVKAKIQNIVDNYYKLREGSKDEKRAAKAAINEILDADPKLKYIYNNISNINKELQAAGLITDKTDGCP